jgi:hypothetical protein
MNTTNTIAIAALAGLFALAAAAPSQAASTRTMKPLHGVSFDVGTERAVSYFESDNGRCKLILTLAGEPDYTEPSLAVHRFEVSIPSQKTTRYVAAGGQTFEFACAAGAEALNVTEIDRLAAAGE